MNFHMIMKQQNNLVSNVVNEVNCKKAFANAFAGAVVHLFIKTFKNLL